jgi:hypothetical protein
MSLEASHPPVDTEWKILKSFIIDVPPSLNADTLPELRGKVAALVRKSNEHRKPRYRIRDLNFRYELDTADRVNRVHVSFVGVRGKSIRLMKLERQDAPRT